MNLKMNALFGFALLSTVTACTNNTTTTPFKGTKVKTHQAPTYGGDRNHHTQKNIDIANISLNDLLNNEKVQLRILDQALRNKQHNNTSIVDHVKDIIVHNTSGQYGITYTFNNGIKIQVKGILLSITKKETQDIRTRNDKVNAAHAIATGYVNGQGTPITEIQKLLNL